jgi:hypothetical protein
VVAESEQLMMPFSQQQFRQSLSRDVCDAWSEQVSNFCRSFDQVHRRLVDWGLDLGEELFEPQSFLDRCGRAREETGRAATEVVSGWVGFIQMQDGYLRRQWSHACDLAKASSLAEASSALSQLTADLSGWLCTGAVAVSRSSGILLDCCENFWEPNAAETAVETTTLPGEAS